MKKALSLLLALVMCLALCACGKSEAVLGCEKRIENLGEITLDSRSAIEYARIAYDSLSEKEQRKVGNYEKLTNAEGKYENLLSELNTQVKELLGKEASAETLSALRQLPDYIEVRKAIASVSRELLSTMIRKNGYRESDAYYWVSGTYTFEIDEDRLRVSVGNSEPRVSAKSSFQFSHSKSSLNFSDDGNYFYRSDFFKYRDNNNFIDVVSVSWSTSIPNTITKKNFTEVYGMDVDSISDFKPWPYTASEDSLDEQFDKESDALDMLEYLTYFLHNQGLPFSAWELAGIYDSDMR